MPFGELPLPLAATVRAQENWRRQAPDSTEWPRGIGTQMPQKESEKIRHGSGQTLRVYHTSVKKEPVYSVIHGRLGRYEC